MIIKYNSPSNFWLKGFCFKDGKTGDFWTHYVFDETGYYVDGKKQDFIDFCLVPEGMA